MVTTQEPKGKLRFTRVVLSEDPDFSTHTGFLQEWKVESQKSIENCCGSLQVDFANSFLGGGVLCGGCVQEEIRFAVCPELIVGCLYCQRMTENEAILITGAQQFSAYKGYAFGLKYGGQFVDETPFNSDGNIDTEICAIDAVDYRGIGSQMQYTPKILKREITKAYVGFDNGDKTKPVATGNWGCGAFLGDRYHKSLLQYLACSAAGRPLVYCTFNDASFSEDMKFVAAKLKDSGWRVSDLWKALVEYVPKRNQNAFAYILSCLPNEEKL